MENNKIEKNISFKRVYIHYPFCKRFCHYCDFYKEKYDSKKEKIYIKNLKKEIEIIKEIYNVLSLFSLYIGGGSPSLASLSFFESIFSLFSFEQNAEVSIEVNIEDISKEFIDKIRDFPINRISIGIQNFVEEYSQFLGRNLDNRLVLKNLDLISKYYENISIDLLIIGLEKDEFKKNKKFLDIVFRNFNIKHISLYILTLYENTKIKKYLKKDRPFIDYIYEKYQNYLKENYFFQYEVSNFAKPGYLCNHNLAYWLFENYIGLGPSATSLFKKKGKFFSRVNEKRISYNSYIEEVSFETYLYFRFRTFFGVPYRYIKNKNLVEDFVSQNLVEIKNKCIKVKERGFLFLDYIFEKFFL